MSLNFPSATDGILWNDPRWSPFLEWTPKVCACLSLLPLFTLHNMDISVRLRHLAVPKLSVIEVVVQAYFSAQPYFVPKSLVHQAEGKICSNPICTHDRLKSSILDVFNNKFDKAVKFSLTKRVYTLFYDPTN